MDFEQKQLLDNLIKQICKDCDIDIDKRHIVNHSMRTIDIIQLTNLGVFFNEIMAYGVHCSLAGLTNVELCNEEDDNCVPLTGYEDYNSFEKAIIENNEITSGE
nr:4596_t:CDS:2 [Entrophospora candida]